MVGLADRKCGRNSDNVGILDFYSNQTSKGTYANFLNYDFTLLDFAFTPTLYTHHNLPEWAHVMQSRGTGAAILYPVNNTTLTPDAARETELTVIDDGQFRYPVLSSELAQWEAVNGPITSRSYEQFCDQVDHAMPGVMPGSSEMIAECERLSDLGFRVYRPA